MSFWKKRKNNTGDEFLVKGGPPQWNKKITKKTFQELSTVKVHYISDYSIASMRWNILRKLIIELFFKEFSVSRRRLIQVSSMSGATDLNTLIGAETFNLFNKELFTSLFQPFGPNIDLRVAIPQDIAVALCAEAADEGISVQDIARRILMYHVDAYPRCMHALELLNRPAPPVPPPASYLDPVLTVDEINKAMSDLQ